MTKKDFVPSIVDVIVQPPSADKFVHLDLKDEHHNRFPFTLTGSAAAKLQRELAAVLAERGAA